MEIQGQLLQEAPNNTVGYSECSVWADRWVEDQFLVPNITGTQSTTLPHDLFGMLFERVRFAPVYRFKYFNRADELANLITSTLPHATGPVAMEVLRRSSWLEPSEIALEDLSIDAQLQDTTSWLGITYDELAQIVGVGRSTLFHWRRGEGPPRASNTRNISRLHALASLLVKRFGVKGAQSWLQAGPDRAWDYLIAGDIASVEERLRSKFFNQDGRNFAPTPTIGDEDDLPPLVMPQKAQTRRAKRPARRGRPGT